VELVLERVEAGSRAVVIDAVVSPKALAAAVVAEAKQRGLNVRVELLENGVAAELDEG
jgi:hypothetical protein